MAHARNIPKKRTDGKPDKNSWGGWFVRCEVPKEHIEHIKSLPEDHARMFEWEEGMARAGYKLSISRNAEKASYVASATDNDPESKTYKGTLSAFAPTAWGAKILLQWKHVELLDGKWDVPSVTGEEWG